MRFQTYVFVTVAHLIPIEAFFAVLTHYYPQEQQPVLFINYIYGCIVILHGLLYFRKRLNFIPEMMTNLKPYADALKESQDKLKLSPQELVALIGRVKEMADGFAPQPGPGVTVSDEKNKDAIKAELLKD